MEAAGPAGAPNIAEPSAPAASSLGGPPAAAQSAASTAQSGLPGLLQGVLPSWYRKSVSSRASKGKQTDGGNKGSAQGSGPRGSTEAVPVLEVGQLEELQGIEPHTCEAGAYPALAGTKTGDNLQEGQATNVSAEAAARAERPDATSHGAADVHEAPESSAPAVSSEPESGLSMECAMLGKILQEIQRRPVS
eukprot:2142610-Pleurochrysis_carterae.AAC.2